MADTESVMPASPVSEEDLARAEEFTRERYLHEGEDPEQVLAPGSPRRRALQDALEEIDAGRDVPSVDWQREYSLMLGLERLLSEETPHLADGTELSAHQVDALSGTLAALMAEAQASGRNGNGNGNGRQNGSVAEEDLGELPSGEPGLEGGDESEGAD